MRIVASSGQCTQTQRVARLVVTARWSFGEVGPVGEGIPRGPPEESMDQYVEYTRRGLFGNIGQSIAGVAFGALLFIAAFPVLWWNEGRLDLSRVAREAVVVGPDA